MVYPLVDLLLVVKNYKGLGGHSFPVEDEAEVSSLALHVCEVYEGGVESEGVKGGGGRQVQTQAGF